MYIFFLKQNYNLPVTNITGSVFMGRASCPSPYAIDILVALGRILSKINTCRKEITLTDELEINLLNLQGKKRGFFQFFLMQITSNLCLVY